MIEVCKGDAEKLADEIRESIRRYGNPDRAVFNELTVAEVVGVLEILKHEVITHTIYSS